MTEIDVDGIPASPSGEPTAPRRGHRRHGDRHPAVADHRGRQGHRPVGRGRGRAVRGRLQPGQHHAEHRHRHRGRRRPVRHLRPGVRRPAHHPPSRGRVGGDLGGGDRHRDRHPRCDGGLLLPHAHHHRPLHRHQPPRVRARTAAGGDLLAPLVRPAACVLRADRVVHRPVEHEGQVRDADVRPDRQQLGGDRGARLVPRDRAPSELGVDRRESPGAGPPRLRHHPRRHRAGRVADPFAAPCRPPPPIPLGPGPRGDADDQPPRRLDLRDRPLQPGGALRRARARGRGEGARRGLRLHLRVHLLPPPLRSGRGLDHDRGRPVARGPLGPRRCARVPAPHGLRPSRHTRDHHPLGGRDADPGAPAHRPGPPPRRPDRGSCRCHRSRARDVLARPARLLCVPLHGAGLPVDAGHPHPVPHLPRRERDQRPPRGRPRRPSRCPWARTVGIHRLHRGRPPRVVGGPYPGRWPRGRRPHRAASPRASSRRG